MKKTILITGATSGMGAAFTKLFSQNGYEVFATYRNDKDALPLQKMENVHPIRMDVTNNEDIQAAFVNISAIVGSKGLYALINNAGITYTAPFEYANEQRARQVMDVNVMAPFKISQTFLPLLKSYNSNNAVKSRIINIASWAGYIGQPFISFYNASKAAIIGLSEAMYYDLGLLDIHVVLAVPGVTKTPLLDKTTSDGVANLKDFPAEGKKFYKPYFDHYSTLSESSRNSKFFPTADDLAKKVFKIVEKDKPRFKYNLAIDAVIVDKFIRKFMPFSWIAKMNKSMFKLSAKAAPPLV